MEISGAGVDPSGAYAIRVQKLAQDQEKVEGAQTVALIEQSSPPPVGASGEGTHINTYA
ncbi:MAG TPA: hypothetical protein VGC42_15165 [Kofleriaceae bacterium]